MPAKPTTVAQYLAQLSADRRKEVEAILKVIRKNLDKDFEEGIHYGCIGFYVPHSVYPAGYHCNPKEPLPFAGLAVRAKHIAIHLFGVYMNPELGEWFAEAWQATGKKLDMGKACVRVKKLEDVPLDVLGALFKRSKVKDFVALYDRELGAGAAKKTAKKATAKKATKKKAAKTRAAKN